MLWSVFLVSCPPRRRNLPLCSSDSGSAQVLTEVAFPQGQHDYFLYLNRFWGRGLAYMSSGTILVVLCLGFVCCGPNLMCFIMGCITFGLGVLYLLAGLATGERHHPGSLARRGGVDHLEKHPAMVSHQVQPAATV